MGGWLDDWRVLVFAYIVCSGLWSVLAKVAASRLDPRTATFVAVMTAAVVVAAATLRGLHWQSGSGVAAAASAGALALGLVAMALLAK